MAALLTSVLHNSDKVAEYIAECRDCGIQVLPPDINHSYGGFTVDGENIRFGLVAIKNIGRGFIQTLIRRRDKEGPFTSFLDFCQRMDDCTDMNKRAVENLIRSGAFDSLGAKRSQLVAVFETVMDSVSASRKQNLEGQMDFFSMGPSASTKLHQIQLPDIPEYSAVEKMNMEKTTTGLYLSGHPMNDYRDLAKAAHAVPIRDILEDFEQEGGPTRFADDQRIRVAGVVTSNKTRPTKNNSLMAYVVVEDEIASIEVLCFQRSIDQCGSYMQVNLPVLVTGRLSVRDEKPPQILCDTIYPLEYQQDPLQQLTGKADIKKEKSVLYLKVPSLNSPEFRHLKLVMTMFEGQMPVKIRLADTGKLLGTTCMNHPALVQECEEWLGKDNVVLRTKAQDNKLYRVKSKPSV